MSWFMFMKSLHEILAEDEDWSLKHVRIGEILVSALLPLIPLVGG